MHNKRAALKAAFPHTIPVLTGYMVLGAAYGILMDSHGFSIVWSLFSSLFIFAGSMQFVTVALLAAGFDPLNTFIMTLMVNARHIFYGISMLKKYQGLGMIKPYLIFSLTDETFSILCSTEPPKGIDRKWFLFFVSVLDQSYWVMGTMLGGILGSIFSLQIKGIEFVLTALFVVLLINQWKSTKNHIPVMIGICSAILCRLVFGSSNFIIPSMLMIIISVTVFKTPIEKRSNS